MSVYKGLHIVVSQMRPIPGDVRKNAKKIRADIIQARLDGANVIVFPELATSGYLLGDRWENESFIREIEEVNDEIRALTGEGKGITAIFGSLRVDLDRIGEDGRVRKYNAVLIASGGEWVSNGVLKGWIPKANLPKYRMFDDARHFYSAVQLAAEMKVPLKEILRPFQIIVDGEQISLALAVCEDLWSDEYPTKPAEIYKKHRVDLLIDVSCSPWTQGKWRARERMLKDRVRDSGLPILYVNAVGLQNNGKNLVWFDGGSTLIDKDGVIRWRAKDHEEDFYLINLEKYLIAPLSELPQVIPQNEDIADTHIAIVQAMRAFLPKGMKVVIGLSGGIDSALSAALAVEAVGKENVLAVNMPTVYNSKTTRALARKCAKMLGIEYQVVSIQSHYMRKLRVLEKRYPNLPSLVKENMQARERGKTLADIAACENGVFLNNGNKTEVALNYFTLYGDAAGAAAFLGDLWKGQVYDLARLINKLAGRDVIPQGIIDIIPSAELSADQNVDEGKGDPIFYEYHDNLLRAFVEKRWDITTVIKHLSAGNLEESIGCKKGVLRKYFATPQEMIKNLEWAWERYNIEFKRVQLPPVFITSRRAFGFDRRDTIADAHVSRSYKIIHDNYLERKEGGWGDEAN